MFMTTVVVASAVGPFLLSAAEEFLGSYRSGFYFASAAALLIALTSPWADNPQRRQGVDRMTGASG